MKPIPLAAWLVAGLAALLPACSHLDGNKRLSPAASVAAAIQAVQERYAPDPHLAIFQVSLVRRGNDLMLTGEVDNPQAKLELKGRLKGLGTRVIDQIEVLPESKLGENTWALSCLSVANGREQPDHKAEMGMQMLMGHWGRVWKTSRRWSLIQTGDGYLSWIENGSFIRCASAQVEVWKNSPLLIVTAFEDRILEKPEADAQPVSDVVMGGLVRKVADAGDWVKVELPDRRGGFLPKNSAEDYTIWQRSRQATPENIERTGRKFLGRPYLWGGNSPKGLDCSGFAKLVFFLNGVQLNRNASQQARQGREVPLDARFSRLRKGDLLFFGRKARVGQPAWITHVGIYLEDRLFIQSSERVRISSLDPDSPIRDEYHLRSLLFARRVLPE